MGTMLRRNSANIGFSRPTTPFRSESKSSLRLSTEAPAPIQDSQTHVPSPVQESAREAEGESIPAVAQAGPSTLSKEVTASPELAPTALKAEAEPTLAPVPQPEPEVQAQPAPVEAPKEETPVPAPVEEVQPAPAAPVEPVVEAKPQAPVPQEREADTFAFTDDIDLKPAPVHEEPAPWPSPKPESQVLVAEPEPILEHETRVETFPEPHDHSFAWRDEPQSRNLSPKPSRSILGETSTSSPRQGIVASPESIARSISPKASKASLSSLNRVVLDTPGGRVKISFDPHQSTGGEPRRGRSRSSSVR